jgi:hypothetical protein
MFGPQSEIEEQVSGNHFCSIRGQIRNPVLLWHEKIARLSLFSLLLLVGVLTEMPFQIDFSSSMSWITVYFYFFYHFYYFYYFYYYVFVIYYDYL